MTTWVALLRGINLGRNKRIAMADLRTLLESLGYDAVRTHLQSGNAIFTAGGTAGTLEREIASGIEAELGLDVKVLARTARQLGAVVERNPFLPQDVDPKALGATFLSAAPSPKVVGDLDSNLVAPDAFAFGDRVVYTYSPRGVMASRLPNWEKLLGLSATARNWNTVTRLHTLASG